MVITRTPFCIFRLPFGIVVNALFELCYNLWNHLQPHFFTNLIISWDPKGPQTSVLMRSILNLMKIGGAGGEVAGILGKSKLFKMVGV